MSIPFISSRAALADAHDLIDRFGEGAVCHAVTLADRSRADGNVVRFCHWRQIARVIATLSSGEIIGSIH